MRIKIVSLLLAVFLLLPIFSVSSFALTPAQAADVDGDGTITARDAAILARFTAGWSGYVDEQGGLTYPWKKAPTPGDFVKSFDPDHPVDLGGYTFRILTFGGGDNGTRDYNGETVQNFSITHFSVMDVSPWTEGSRFDSEDRAKYFTKMSRAVAARNAYLETTYNCHIEEVRVLDPFSELYDDVLSGSRSYDLATCSVGLLSSASAYANLSGLSTPAQVTSGVFANVLKIPTVDITKEWYDDDLLKGLAWNDTLYYLTGASDSTLRQAVFLPIIGLKSVSDAYTDLNDPLAAGNYLYDLILNGEWTVDKLTEIVNTCYAAYPDKTGRYTYSAASTSNVIFALGAGFSPCDPDGDSLYADFDSCPGSAAFMKLRDFLAAHRTTSELSAYTGGLEKSKIIMRAIGAGVYCHGTAYSYTAAGNWIAPVPFPKGDVSQTSYITHPNPGFAYLYVIPKVNRAELSARARGFETGVDMEGYFLSAFMEASLAKHNDLGYDVRDALIEQLAALGSVHNSAFVTESFPQGKPRAVLDAIYDGLTLNAAYVYTPSVMNALSNCAAKDENWNTLASRYNSALDKQAEYLDRIHDYMKLDQ